MNHAKIRRRLAVISLFGIFICLQPAIVDGDTFACGRQRVRLWGVDAPEVSTLPGRHAKAALGAEIGGAVGICRKRGVSYARVVAKCTFRARDPARSLVEAGHARDWPRFSGGYYAR